MRVIQSPSTTAIPNALTWAISRLVSRVILGNEDDFVGCCIDLGQYQQLEKIIDANVRPFNTIGIKDSLLMAPSIHWEDSGFAYPRKVCFAYFPTVLFSVATTWLLSSIPFRKVIRKEDYTGLSVRI